jgi:hypothetical protein
MRIRAMWRRLPVVGFLAGRPPGFSDHLERLMDERARRPPEPVNIEEHFITQILHSGGSAQVGDFVKWGEGDELTEWLRDAERLGFVTRPDPDTICVTDHGRARLDELVQPETRLTIHPNGLTTGWRVRRARPSGWSPGDSSSHH